MDRHMNGGEAGDVRELRVERPANNLLRALRAEDLSLLTPHLSPWFADTETVLYEPGDTVQTVYFPCGPSLVSYVVMLEDGRGVETALVGREGALGGIVSQGRLPAYARGLVQFPGPFYRIESRALEEAKAQSATLRYLFARYADCLLAQVFQSVACNATHTIEQRVAKWLTAALDRTGDHDVPLTQEQLASMLGVGRSYISRVVQNMKSRGVLETRRGGVRVRDRDQLHQLSCGCNDAVRAHFDDVLKGVYPTEEESTVLKLNAGAASPGSRMPG
ncbi:Crp/Fnr family transcriptional regulator [Frateuria terrea]|uniref:cAMP-binding domain of CRP or a regulatory subunit of cAMP-dependent protein kinases n=1 Tax=Frateuria terrea TaxID=529704 RepID=A0A1H6QNZ8_9GAMM|nr:Crp/Fnr family transcriptional regulator [Frateuria terrea]SEI40702.1 cAMP-binding domain of CRP or a regulatory subunit of cAMP-dependent protein kinases [Frateuria terrea]SFP06055.1 cAMP-binding domain of CRP or a regulatory subunit of cAMP-dependent protein kinases [Frateuria terrea]